VAYLPSLAGPFHFDDYNVIVHYETVHSWQALAERWGGGVRPLLKASYTLNWTLGPGEFGFHLFNNTVHALNAVLLFFIGKELFPKSENAILTAALLFALHPAATEAVTYISGRSSSLMASFYLGALLAYLRGGHWSVSSFLFLCAAAVRETAVTLPAALVLAEAARGWPGWREVLRRQWAHWALLAAGALFILLNARYFQHLAFGYTLRGLGENLLTQVGGISYLVSRLVGLHGYNIDPDLPTLSAWDSTLAMQAMLLAFLAIIGMMNFFKRPWIAFGILWFFLQLAPTNSIVPRVDVANDRQLYLAGWGIFMALLLSFPRIPGWVTVTLVAAFAISSIHRQLDYASEIRLWESSVRLAPGNSRAHNNLGYAYQLEGRTAEARREYDTALVLDPGNRKARYNRMLLP
jgi:tetratricopeptide (TPR) repeat protein